MSTGIQIIAVIGAGQMGGGIAQTAAAKGHKVWLYDVEEKQLQKTLAGIEKSLAKFLEKNKITKEKFDQTVAALNLTTEFADLKEADFCIEAVPENRELKKKVFYELDALAKPETILATNTSSIPIAEIAKATHRPDRVIGMHFMNPVPLMPCVEVIRGPETSDATHAATMELARKMGKTPVTVKDAPGFVVNRILLPMLDEAIRAYEEGLATREDIDAAMKLSCNFPMGPLTLADFVGLDTCLSILEVMGREPSPLLRRLVKEGKLGKKTGEGFYKYGL